jgi:hypothetical protein
MLHMLQVFQRYVVNVCSKCFICFSLILQQVFSCILQVASVLSGYCICFTYMLQSVRFICFRRIFHPSVSCCSESHADRRTARTLGHGGTASRGPVNGARGTPGPEYGGALGRGACGQWRVAPGC